MRTWWAPRVRTLVGALFLLVLALPFLMMGIERLFENALILETEHTLIVEAVALGEVYRQATDPKRAMTPLPPPGSDEDRFAPIVPRLDLSASPLLPPATREGRARTASVASPLDRLLERAMVRNLSGIRVLDADGVVVASSASEVGYRLAHLPEVRAALAGEYRPVLRRRFSDEPDPPITSLSRAADLRVSLAVPVFADPRTKVGTGGRVLGVVYGSRTPLDTTKALWAWREKLYLPFLFSVAVTLFAVVFLTFSLSRPLTRLRQHAEQVAHGAPAAGYRVGRVAPQEMHVLAASLERMSLQLAKRADYIREFAANAAHELKTPLTSLRGAADLMLEAGEDMPPERRRRFLENISSDAVRMDQLVRRILELARIEASAPERVPIELRAYLEGLCERYRRRGEPVRLEATSEGAVRGALEQLESLFVNLLDNAVRHAAGGDVQVVLRREAGEVVVEVIDAGPALAPDALDRVFERFYSTSREQGGTGLGLAIVKAVAEAHGGTVSAKVESRGARFVVRLPAGEVRG